MPMAIGVMHGLSLHPSNCCRGIITCLTWNENPYHAVVESRLVQLSIFTLYKTLSHRIALTSREETLSSYVHWKLYCRSKTCVLLIAYISILQPLQMCKGFEFSLETKNWTFLPDNYRLNINVRYILVFNLPHATNVWPATLYWARTQQTAFMHLFLLFMAT